MPKGAKLCNVGVECAVARMKLWYQLQEKASRAFETAILQHPEIYGVKPTGRQRGKQPIRVKR